MAQMRIDKLLIIETPQYIESDRFLHKPESYTPFTRSSKHRAIIEQTFSKCI